MQIYRFIDHILAGSEHAEQGIYQRRTFFRHARYFISCFVSLRCRNILDRSALDLTQEEQATLSRAVNEFAELIYESAEAIRSDKGYLAFFKNQTDCQQLADRILHPLLQEAAVGLACFTAIPMPSEQLLQHRNAINVIQLIVVAKTEVNRLLNENTIDRQLFTETVNGIRVRRFIQVYHLIDRILGASEQAEQGNNQRQSFFRHARYFISCFVGLRCRNILDRSVLDLTQEEQATLSRAVDEFADLIYESAEAIRSDKDYLAFFQNQTDTQQLADVVLRRLDQQDTQATPVAPPAIV